VDSLFAVLQRLNAEPQIRAAASLDFSPPDQAVDSRFPTDGPGQAKSDWGNATMGTWAMRAIRAPLAWGCETGTYGAPLPAVGIFEWKHQRPTRSSPRRRLSCGSRPTHPWPISRRRQQRGSIPWRDMQRPRRACLPPKVITRQGSRG